MTDKRGYFDHYQVGGAWGRWVQRKLTTKPVPERIHPPSSPKYKGEGLCVGANVQVLPTAPVFDLTYRRRQGGFPAQVWARASADLMRSGKWWWVADGQNYYMVEERDLLVLGHCHDEPLFETA